MKFYYVRTRNWFGLKKCADILEKSQELYGYVIYNNFNDIPNTKPEYDFKYELVINNKEHAEKCYNFFCEMAKFTGGETYWYSVEFEPMEANGKYEDLGNYKAVA